MPRGGARPGAGRKSNAEIHAIRSVIDEIVSPAEWQKIITNLLTLAKKGNVRATQLLFTYRFGDPYAAPPPPDVEPIRVIYNYSQDPNAKPYEVNRFPKPGEPAYFPVDPETHERLPLPKSSHNRK